MMTLSVTQYFFNSYNFVVDCTIPMVKNNITLKYNSTLEDSLLMFQCDNGLFPEDLFIARCYKNGSWIPNPSSHICSNSSAGRKKPDNLYSYILADELLLYYQPTVVILLLPQTAILNLTRAL